MTRRPERGGGNAPALEGPRSATPPKDKVALDTEEGPSSLPTPTPRRSCHATVCQAAFQPMTGVGEPLSHTGMVTKNVPNGLTLWAHPPKSAKQVQPQVASTFPVLTKGQTDLPLRPCERHRPGEHWE